MKPKEHKRETGGRLSRDDRQRAEDGVFRVLDGGRMRAPEARALEADVSRGEIRKAVVTRLDLENVLDAARCEIARHARVRQLIEALVAELDVLRVTDDPADPLHRRRAQLRAAIGGQPAAEMVDRIDRVPIIALQSALEKALDAIPNVDPTDVTLYVAELAVAHGHSTDDVSVALGKSRSWLRKRRTDATARSKK